MADYSCKQIAAFGCIWIGAPPVKPADIGCWEVGSVGFCSAVSQAILADQQHRVLSLAVGSEDEVLRGIIQ